jgi:hypothetical protein
LIVNKTSLSRSLARARELSLITNAELSGASFFIKSPLSPGYIHRERERAREREREGERESLVRVTLVVTLVEPAMLERFLGRDARLGVQVQQSVAFCRHTHTNTRAHRENIERERACVCVCERERERERERVERIRMHILRHTCTHM